ncbi:MAG: SAM-dependent methyltransferase [Ruminococcaceae bacterium]|nr:SAM-dependent methyltransferase [Oscillospiraceae bacterium]
MKLDNRLMAIADLVRKDKIFADIGTDHAYLPVYLVEKGIVNHAIAADLRVGPLDNAKETVVSHNLTDKIELRLSDGLDNFKENEVEEIAVAGMGGLLISSFIERTIWLKNSDIHLILQPMTHIEELRKTLFDNDFIIDNEVVAEDGDKLYIIISAYYYGDATAYTDLDLIVGRLTLNDDELSKNYLAKIYTKYNKKLVALQKAQKECADLEKIVGELSKWQQ